MAAVLCVEECGFGRGTPTYAVDSLSMLSKCYWLFPPVFLMLNRKQLSFCGAASEYEAVLPWSPGDASDRRRQLTFSHLLPLPLSLLLPDFHALVVAATRNDIFILRVGPSHLPNGSLMRFEEGAGRDLLFGRRIIIHVAHLDETVAVARR